MRVRVISSELMTILTCSYTGSTPTQDLLPPPGALTVYRPASV